MVSERQTKDDSHVYMNRFGTPKVYRNESPGLFSRMEFMCLVSIRYEWRQANDYGN